MMRHTGSTETSRIVMRGWLPAVLVIFATTMSGCRTTHRAAIEQIPYWNPDHYEILEWHADDPAFDQDYALEASGLTADDGTLYATSEKYARMLIIRPEESMTAQVVRLGVPTHSELEGIAISGDIAYICDEAHAAVHAVDLGFLDGDRPLPSRVLDLQGVPVGRGKIGFEGVAVTQDGRLLYLLLERGRDPHNGCVSTIFQMRVTRDRLTTTGEPIQVALQDCNWRLTGLELWHGQLLALRTKFPGERYEIIAIDPRRGTWRVHEDLTEILRSARSRGWGNNVEGIAVTDDGTLYLVSDNAVTLVADADEPTLTGERTLFLRIPPTRSR
jgi:DNA-binding beta-propeller fold protein YncE